MKFPDFSRVSLTKNLFPDFSRVSLTKHLFPDFSRVSRTAGHPGIGALSHTCQGSGGTYFITVPSIIEEVQIQHSKLALQLNIDFVGKDGHSCCICSRKLNEEDGEILSQPLVDNNTLISYMCIHCRI